MSTRDPGAPLAIALVGAGRVARTYAHAIAGEPGLRLAAVVGRQAEAARALAAMAMAPACAVHAEVEELAADPGGVEAAIVCTPPASHPAIACRLLASGLHVLGEKPFAPTPAAAMAMAAAARRAGRTLLLAAKYRHFPAVGEARRLVAAGAIGAPVFYESAFLQRAAMAGDWYADAAVSGGGVLADNGPHAADLLRFVLAPIEAVSAAAGPRLQGLAVEETVALAARVAGGALARIDLSWSADSPGETCLRIAGSEGIVEVGWRASRWRRSGAAWTPFGSPYDKLAAFRGVLADFAAAVRGAAASTSLADALASVAVVAAGYASLASGAWTAVADLPG